MSRKREHEQEESGSMMDNSMSRDRPERSDPDNDYTYTGTILGLSKAFLANKSHMQYSWIYESLKSGMNPDSANVNTKTSRSSDNPYENNWEICTYDEYPELRNSNYEVYAKATGTQQRDNIVRGGNMILVKKPKKDYDMCNQRYQEEFHNLRKNSYKESNGGNKSTFYKAENNRTSYHSRGNLNFQGR